MNYRKIGLVIAALGAVGALLGGLATFLGREGSDSVGITNTGDGNQNYCAQVKGPCNVNVVTPSPEFGDNDDTIAAQIRRDGPWVRPGARPFMVLRDIVDGEKLGVYVRTTPTQAGQRLGILQHHAIAWVDCVATTDFDPDPGTRNGPWWYRVHYKPPSDAGPLESNPEDPQTGWSYAYYLSPSGHSGELPTCTSIN